MQPEYTKIVALLQKYGSVSSSHIADDTLPIHGETEFTEEQIYEKEMKRLAECDIIVAEVTMPSLGVGYLIAKAESENKKILCLFQGDPTHKLSAMILGNPSLQICSYSEITELEQLFESHFSN